jgi:hypothetical protein
MLDQAAEKRQSDHMDLGVANFIKSVYNQATDRPHGVSDTCVKQLDLSHSIWVCRAAGVLQGLERLSP